MNIADARNQFIRHLEDRTRSSSTILAYSKDIQQLENFLSKTGISEVEQIKASHLRAFMDEFENQGYSAKSISRKTNSTKTFFKFLRSSGTITTDPATEIIHPKFENKPPRILSKIEYRALRDSARSDPRMSAIIELLLQTGIRIGELSKIQLEDITLENEPKLYIRPSEGATERTIPLNDSVVDGINRYLDIRPNTANQSLFVTKTGKPLLVRNIRTAIDRYFKSAGVEKAKVNDLRHTWVAHHLASGVSLILVSKLAGHKRISTTEKYLQYIQNPKVESKIKLEVL